MSEEVAKYTPLEGSIALVEMNDGKANALSEAMIAGLISALDRAEKEANAVILTGRPDRFCAGFDLKIMMSGPEAATNLLRKGSDLLMRLYGCKVPLIIASTGHALAGGALVLLTGDVRIGAEGAYRIGLNEVSIGLPVPVLAMELARDRIRPTELAKATLMATIYDPLSAAEAGYLDAVTSADTLMAKAKEEATKLAGLSKPAYQQTKARLRGKTIEYIQATLESDFVNIMGAK